MNRDEAVQKLVAPMAERVVDVDGAAFRVDRARVLARMMEEASRSERPRRWPYFLLAAAGVAVFVVAARLWHPVGPSGRGASLEVVVSEGTATQIRSDAVAPLAPKASTHISADGDLETAADSKAQVRTADGLQIELEGRTRVAFGELQASLHQVKLLSGAVQCRVPHRSGSPFQVVTSDATVVDLGTVFTVSIEGPNHATRVSVEEGEVLVRHATGQTRVQAPNTWSSAARGEPAAIVAAAEGTTSVTASAPTYGSSHSAAKVARGAAVPAATLTEEAQLLRQGLAAERQGHASEAISVLTRLVTTYPRSPLIPDARAALTRVEASAQP